VESFNVLLIALGGAIGAVSRYSMVMFVHRWLGVNFPYGTLVVNVLGSLAIGLISEILLQRIWDDGHWRAFLIIGGLGAFTTFSSFSMDTLSLMENGQMGLASMNILLNVLLCLAAVYMGCLLARLL